MISNKVSLGTFFWAPLETNNANRTNMRTIICFPRPRLLSEYFNQYCQYQYPIGHMYVKLWLAQLAANQRILIGNGSCLICRIKRETPAHKAEQFVLVPTWEHLLMADRKQSKVHSTAKYRSKFWSFYRKEAFYAKARRDLSIISTFQKQNLCKQKLLYIQSNAILTHNFKPYFLRKKCAL